MIIITIMEMILEISLKSVQGEAALMIMIMDIIATSSPP
jgi:hypothetical protein